MTSEAQLNANRENAQHSTGPRTEEGKKRSNLNSRRHGLTGQFYAMTPQDREAYEQHCTLLLADLKPETYREKVLAISIAEDQWRLHRARALETNIYAYGHGTDPGDLDCRHEEIHACLAQARTWLQDSSNLGLLSLYENRIRRNIEKNEKQLAALQAERKAAHEQALEEALLLTQLALMKGQPVDPEAEVQSNGFVFSTGSLVAILTRKQRLHEAAFFQKHAWNSRAPYRTAYKTMPQAA